MQASNAPAKIQVPFANSGAKQNIPVASQIGITDGRASYTDGFPPLTRTPVVAGGVPPFGTDMNGILNAITAIQQWQNAGGFPQYDSAFSTAVGGYPKYAILQKADGTGLWISTADNNTNNPDTGGANWVDLTQGATYGLDTGTANTYAVTYAPAITAIKDGMVLRFKALNANTGASTFNPNGLGALPIVMPSGSALGAGIIAAGSEVWLQYNSTISSWVSVLSTSVVAATTTQAGISRFATTGEVSAGTALNIAVDPAGIASAYAKKATTLSGYGITDAYTSAQTDSLLAAKAPLASPALTGTPTAPTAAAGTNTTQLATTAFVATGLATKQASLGFTPIQQGGGANQSNNKLYIGWGFDSTLGLQVDSTNFGNIWPISVSGRAAGNYVLNGSVALSGTAVDFTYIPSWVKRLRVCLNRASVNEVTAIMVQLGTSAGVVNSGYIGSIGVFANGSSGVQSLSSGVQVNLSSAKAEVIYGGIIEFENMGGNVWAFKSSIGSSLPDIGSAGGSITLPDVLTKLRLTSYSGTASFNDGTASLTYEG